MWLGPQLLHIFIGLWNLWVRKCSSVGTFGWTFFGCCGKQQQQRKNEVKENILNDYINWHLKKHFYHKMHGLAEAEASPKGMERIARTFLSKGNYKQV